jgi:peptidoglycan/xylan/chitin deacetylase (PgdA/CDA1 family)
MTMAECDSPGWGYLAPATIFLCGLAALAVLALVWRRQRRAEQVPLPVAWLTRWPAGLNTRAGFDAASRSELLQLVAVLADTAVPANWQATIRPTLLRSWRAASGNPLEWSTLVARARLTDRDVARREFWAAWIAQQSRLAWIFPETTSEIFPLRDSDLTGGEADDLEFALTFDDGPTPPGGTTDATIAQLRALRLPATFFVVGKRLATRRDARALYAGFDVALHGDRHLPHLAPDIATASVLRMQQRLVATVDQPQTMLFRPPFGQRTDEVAKWLEARSMRTVLWNIDSQDWRSDARTDRVAGRVLALMLALRAGIILLHDVHGIVAAVLPLLAETLGETVRWRGADAFAPPPGSAAYTAFHATRA